MFLDNLASSLLEIIEENKLTYQKLADKCELSERYMGKLIRKESTPTIKTLQKICRSTNHTPNQLFKIDTDEELSYRSALRVSKTAHFGKHEYCFCPRCDTILLRHNQHFCAECGQKLDWE